MTRSQAPLLHIVGVPIHAATFEDLLDAIAAWIADGTRTYQICTASPEFVMIAQTDRGFMRVLHEADLCVPDGVGLLFAARYLGKRLPERVTGSDGVPLIAQRAAREGWRLFLLGAGPGIADKAAQRLQEQFPGLDIAGTFAGSPAADEADAIITRINASRADVLLVAYGAPKQDLWIAEHLTKLPSVRVAMGVGGTFDFLAGTAKRAPQWMRSLGLEWLWRLLLEPWRAKRIWTAVVVFPFLVLTRSPRTDPQ